MSEDKDKMHLAELEQDILGEKLRPVIANYESIIKHKDACIKELEAHNEALREESDDYRNRFNRIINEGDERVKELETQQGCRPEVLAFATEMERVLKTNDYKGGWKHSDLTYLKRRLTQERGEFERALSRYRADPEHEHSKREVLDEACDIANFLMMTCDVIGALTPPTKEGGKE